MGASRNIFLYSLYQILTLEGVCHGLYVLWLTSEKSLSPFAIAFLLAVGDVVVTLGQIPAGRLADRLGHRTCLILGSAAQVIGIVTFWQAEGLTALTLASAAIGAGDALRGGADEALLYESLDRLGQQQRFGSLLARIRQRTQFALVALLLGGGWLATNCGFSLVWMIEVLLAALGLAVAFCMVDLPRSEDRVVPDTRRLAPPARLVLPASTLVALAAATSLAVELSWPGSPQGLTIVVAGTMLCEGIGAGIATNQNLRFCQRLVWLCLVLVATLMVATPAVLLTATVVASLATSLAQGAADPIRAAELQAWASPAGRATAASAAYTSDMLFQTAGILVCGWLLS